MLFAAYRRCLTFAAKAPRLKTVPGCLPPLICARLLGQLLRLAPNGEGRRQLQQDITSAADNTALMGVAGMYFNNLILPFKRYPRRRIRQFRRAMAPSSYKYIAEVEDGTLTPQVAWHAAMLRDKYCCVATGIADQYRVGMGFLQSTHIIPPLHVNIPGSGHKRIQNANVAKTLSMFTDDPNLVSDLTGKKTHRLENILLMGTGLDSAFNKLWIWFKPVVGAAPHTYSIELLQEEWREIEHIHKFVTFRTNTCFPPPSSSYLALHALCSEVAWLSGATEYMRNKDIN